MYLKKVDGPRAVKLPDGTIISRADLPAKGTRRWVASRKAAVVRGIEAGLISREEAMERWTLSSEELAEWEAAIVAFGEEALKATRLQEYRQP